MQKTQHYELKKPEITDPLRVADFNENSDLIDAALAANAKALSDYKTANDAVVAKKAAQSALDSTNSTLASVQQSVAAHGTDLAALAAALGSGGKNARIAWGSYTGNETYGADNPITLTFDFYPVMVFVGSDTNASYGSNPSVLMRGRTQSHPDNVSFTSGVFQINWTDNAVSWYSEYAASEQNNSAQTYHYVAVGYDKAANA